MVYCGKPSKGCLACRSRKTRCDRAAPSCGQCIRAKRECPGYRNQLDLMFRNESQTVIGKVTTRKTRKQKPAPSSAKSSPKSSTLTDTVEVKKSDSSESDEESLVPFLFQQTYVPNSLSPSIHDRALGFYKNREAIWLRNFDLVETICNQSNTDECLLASLSAVGLASYAASVRSPGLMIKARRDYGKALRLTNAALKSPTEFTKDSTLFSVVSLGIFEAVSGNGEESLTAWAKHLAGAAELVKLRGLTQFRTVAGQRMFSQITSNLMAHSVQHGKTLPTHILELRAAATPFVDTEDPAWRISDAIIQFSFLRAKVVEKLSNPRALIRQALDIDAEFIDILEKMPPEWHPRTYFNNECPEAVWKGKYTIYNDFWMAQMHNALRAFRIHAHQILREQLVALSPDSTPVFSDKESTEMLTTSIGIMLEMQGQILANIPQYAPWGISFFPSSSPIEPWQVYHVLWPLFLAGNMDITSPDIQEWVMNRFRAMGEQGGIEHANVLANSMLTRQKLKLRERTSAGQYSQALKMSPFNWNLDGWAIAQAVILSAQINKPTVAAKMPPRGMTGPPPGWTGPPPPGWNGQLPPSSSEGPSSGSSQTSISPSPDFPRGPPPGWTGPPPPGWNGQLPPSFSKYASSASSPASISLSPAPQGKAPPDFSRGPPPGWTGPPPPGWNGQLPPALTESSPSKMPMNIPPKSLLEPLSFSKGPPPGWVGPPPPGWNGGLPPSSSAGPMSVTAPKGPPAGLSSFIPPGWTGPPPPGWQPPPGFKMPLTTASTSPGGPPKSKKKGHSSKGSNGGKIVEV